MTAVTLHFIVEQYTTAATVSFRLLYGVCIQTESVASFLKKVAMLLFEVKLLPAGLPMPNNSLCSLPAGCSRHTSASQ